MFVDISNVLSNMFGLAKCSRFMNRSNLHMQTENLISVTQNQCLRWYNCCNFADFFHVLLSQDDANEATHLSDHPSIDMWTVGHAESENTIIAIILWRCFVNLKSYIHEHKSHSIRIYSIVYRVGGQKILDITGIFVSKHFSKWCCCTLKLITYRGWNAARFD